MRIDGERGKGERGEQSNEEFHGVSRGGQDFEVNQRGSLRAGRVGKGGRWRGRGSSDGARRLGHRRGMLGHRCERIAKVRERVLRGGAAQSGLDVADVRRHEPLGGLEVATLQRSDDLHVLAAALAGIVRRLIQHRDERGARGQVAQRVGEQCVADAFGEAHVEVAEKEAAGADIVGAQCSPLAREVRLELAYRRCIDGRHMADEPELDHAPRGERFLRLDDGGLDDVPPAACIDGDDAALRQPGERLADHRSAHREDRCELRFTEARAGRQALREDRLDDAIGDFGRGGHAS